ncbi:MULTISPECIES: hypothetical protein [Paenarthrobacter]|uniref:Uncharacterized protein n=1 Tax=Paenarthrobacter ureafaciens TaxID=37931 RepID=A0AAX3EDK5_PAEUR|nr:MULTISPECIES: hypothetical protein [Paenarthrobacter]NKR13323.1 hypothetical protein [Arthrobacter sp. M5]NKR14827.1 hypothetical protein [Arthrobacter sp. M6]OEH62380.1 hypothetical protein A5N13_01605 [Arthrobacter sp. D4]OEH62951.1 hypothetical protein A5N17_09845 [Arthrobacter sp. D2]MDO5865125.1 hypothetical protein [Paenarthrobacter sp. SD-2]
MSADMLTAVIAVPADRTKPIDFERGRRMVEETPDAEAFRFDDPESQLEELVEDFDPDVHLDADGEPAPEVLKSVGRRIIDKLEKTLDSSETNTIDVAGYRLYLSGGLSSGDSPTDAAGAIWHAHHLPVAVLLAMGFIPDYSRPLSRTNGNPGRVTDTDIVDAIALGLGTKPEWSGADELEWIANAIGSVRPHPGDWDPAEYHVEFTEQHGFDPVNDNFLIGYVSQYDNQEGGD